MRTLYHIPARDAMPGGEYHAGMSSWRPFCVAVHLTALGLWAGAVAISGATAAVAFPKLHGMEVLIRKPVIAPGFEEDHFRFAAGGVAQTVFLIADMVSFACAFAAAVTLLAMVVWLKLPTRRVSTYVRALAVGIALAALAASLFVVTPQINAAAAAHLQAAIAGDAATAAVHRRAAADLHPFASVLLLLQLGGALIAAFAGAWSLAEMPAAERSVGKAAYPEPDLLKRKRG